MYSETTEINFCQELIPDLFDNIISEHQPMYIKKWTIIYPPPSLSLSLSHSLCNCSHILLVTAADSDMDKVGNSFLQIKMVLNKGAGTEEVFMGKSQLLKESFNFRLP